MSHTLTHKVLKFKFIPSLATGTVVSADPRGFGDLDLGGFLVFNSSSCFMFHYPKDKLLPRSSSGLRQIYKSLNRSSWKMAMTEQKEVFTWLYVLPRTPARLWHSVKSAPTLTPLSSQSQTHSSALAPTRRNSPANTFLLPANALQPAHKRKKDLVYSDKICGFEEYFFFFFTEYFPQYIFSLISHLLIRHNQSLLRVVIR